MKRIFILLCLALSPFSYAKVVQVLHTNDMHSYIKNTGVDEMRGGYAAIKVEADRQRALASAAGIPTLFMDGGDFLEGNILYIVDKGKAVMDVISEMNYDAVVIGNHDWLMGVRALDQLLERANPTFDIVGANFEIPFKFTNIKDHIMPYKIFEFDGHAIAVLGLTTNSPLYSWRVEEGQVASPIKTAKKYLKQFKSEMAIDSVIALTHMGVSSDVKLVKATRGIDLVVGGHSHSALTRPQYARDRDDQLVPIVQAGKHGNYLGKLIVDLSKDRPAKVLSYELIPIDQLEKDPVVEDMVERAEDELYQVYQDKNLDEILGLTELDLGRGETEYSLWGDVKADAFREALESDAAIHVAMFGGHGLKKGPITRRNILESYPRYFEFENTEGWHIYNVKVQGWLLKLLVNYTLNSGYPLYFSGFKFDVRRSKSGKLSAKGLRVRGQRYKLFKWYNVSIPEGLVRGGLGITSLVNWIMRSIGKSDVSAWQALEDKVMEVGVIDENYHNRSRKDRGENIDRVFIPQHKDLD